MAKAWHRHVHIQERRLLLMIDYASSYIEIAKLAETTSSDVIIRIRTMHCQPTLPSVQWQNGTDSVDR